MTRRTYLLQTIPSLVVFCSLLAARLLAQQPPGQQQQRGELPTPAELRVPAVDPKLEQILKRWELESAKIKVLQGEHLRREFDMVFHVEKRAEGRFFFEAPDKGRFDMIGSEIPNGTKSTDPETKASFDVVAGTSQKWVCDGQSVLMIDPTTKQFERHAIPQELQGQNIVQSPLPFLFGMKADDAKRRFHLTLYGENQLGYWIDAVPRLKMDAQNYQHARIILDRTTFVPVGVELLDPAGTTKTRYGFRNVKVNPEPSAFGLVLNWFKDKDPFRPDLRGYTQVQFQDPQAPGGPARGGQPNSRSANTIPAGFPQPASRPSLPPR